MRGKPADERSGEDVCDLDDAVVFEPVHQPASCADVAIGGRHLDAGRDPEPAGPNQIGFTRAAQRAAPDPLATGEA